MNNAELHKLQSLISKARDTAIHGDTPRAIVLMTNARDKVRQTLKQKEATAVEKRRGRQIVIFAKPGGSALLLTDVVRNADGSIKAGDVINGGWRLEFCNREMLAKAGSSIVTRWPAPAEIDEWEVPDNLSVPFAYTNYNEVIALAMDAQKAH